MKELYAALSKAQSEFKSITKNKEVTKRGKDKYDKWFEYKYKYADLDQIVEIIRPVLAKNGLTFSQTINENECVTNIGHEFGSAIFSRCPIFIEGKDMQKLGAAITYARRYGLSLALGITADDDLDANELQQEPHEVKDVQKPKPSTYNGVVTNYAQFVGQSTTTAEVNKPPAAYTPSKYSLSEKQVARLFAIAKEWPKKYVDAYLKGTFGVQSSKDLSRADYDAACDFLQNTSCTEAVKLKYEEFAAEPKIMDAFKKAKKDFIDHTQSNSTPPPDIFAPFTDELPF